MHLVWEKSGEFKDLDASQEQYIFSKPVWEAIGAATAKSGATIPSAYRVHVPKLAADGVYMSVEMLLFWTLYLGPVLLRGHFQDESYYNHFVELVRLLNICLQFKITSEELEDIRVGFIRWVEEYERQVIYYQFDPDRVALCPLTIHALLHIAPEIKASDPVWCYWAFPMERYCGKLGPTIRSRCFPFAALARQVLEEAQLAQVKVMFGVSKELSLNGHQPSLGQQGGFFDLAYPTCILLPPLDLTSPEVSELTPLIGASVTRFQMDVPQLTVSTVKSCLGKAKIERWGKVKCIDSDEGDTMRAVEVGKLREDNRDASFIRYEMYVDRNADNGHSREDFELQTYYGQLQQIFVVRFTEPQPRLKLTCPTTLIMCQIRSCRLLHSQIAALDIHFFEGMGKLDVVDVTSIQCLVGRVPCGGSKYAIIDRSGSLARAEQD
ncbi:hypothetical protein L218DRAFT_1022754 [Marasmius fiardii PR-910]|nr:hypothetical protein L218DRAFT_1022754 [Marasmius fiardii PR-910]